MPIEIQKEVLKSFLLSNQNTGYCREKWFKKHYVELYNDFLTWNFPDDFRFPQKLFHYLNDDKELKLGHCIVCEKRCSFGNFKHGYPQHCSFKCVGKDKERVEKMKQTCLEKYGVDNPFKNEEIKEKIKQTNLEKYGVENYAQTEECKEKAKQTNLERYSVEYYSQTDEHNERVKQTSQEKFGTDYYTQTDEYKERARQTCLDKYGVDNPFKDEAIKEKIKQTNLEKYGVESYTQSDEFKEKYKQTCLEKYDAESYTQTDDFKENFKNSDWVKKSIEHPYYLNAIKVWTKRDVKKREIAKKNNLNYLEIFSCNLDEVATSINNYIFSLGAYGGE
jgi:hypothetical protein